MGVYAIKSEKPIVTTKPLVRNTVNQDYMNWVNYMNTHDFTFKPIVTTKPLVRNTVNQDYMNWVNYMNTHDFTFKIDKDNNLKVKATKDKDNNLKVKATK
ncbi:hypothetical protein DXA10_13270 [Firmicutes bacterium AM55-24TS]|nr:hypothetical protein DXA10_13270 [Firmicutes bacterium AM55-24TS]